jgi:hypothetical protein
MAVTLEALLQKHPIWEAQHEHWELLNKIVAGGIKLDPETKALLLANPDGRSAKVVKERVKCSTYVNIVGSVLTRILTQLMQEEGAYKGLPGEFWAKFFKQGFILDNDDDARSSFHLGLEAAMRQAFIEGQAIAEISTKFTKQSGSLAEQTQNGENEPYVILLPRSAMWDWEDDEHGFVFVKIHRLQTIRPTWDAIPQQIHHFSIFQRSPDGKVTNSQYTVRLKEPKRGETFRLESINPDKIIIETVTVDGLPFEGIEVFNRQGVFRFPIVTLTLPSTLWIADQLFELTRENYNVRAGINWKLQACNFSMPVVIEPIGYDGDGEDIVKDKKFGDGYYLSFPNGTQVTQLELGSGAINIAIQYLDNIKKELLELLQQIAAAAASTAAALARSADSKREDRKPEVLLMLVLGSMLKQFSKQILECAAIAHNDSPDTIEVTGFDNFLGDIFGELINDLATLMTNTVPSPTIAREGSKIVAARFTQKYNISDPKIEAKINSEIDEAKVFPNSLQLPFGIPPAPVANPQPTQ